jgi:hypothetical protein
MIEQVQNGESGLSARTKINQAISKVNSSGTQLLGSASVNLNLPDVPLPYYRLSNSTFDPTNIASIDNAKLTYTSGTGSFTLYEYVTDDNGNYGTVFYNTTSSMSLAFLTISTANPFAPGVGFTGSLSGKTATVVTIVSESLLTPGESIKSLDSSSATVVTSQSGSGVYFANSEITSVTGSFKISYLELGLAMSINPWIPGETINDITSGASAKLIYQYGAELVVKSVTGSFSTGDVISGSLSGNTNGLGQDLYANSYLFNVVVGQTSKVAFPIDNLFTSSHADQTITLSSGSKFVVTDVLMTNAVGTYVSASDGPFLYTSQSQDGYAIALGVPESYFGPKGKTPGTIGTLLAAPNSYANNISYINAGGSTGIALPSQVTVGSTLYYSNVPNSSSATADVYVYGYILS